MHGFFTLLLHDHGFRRRGSPGYLEYQKWYISIPGWAVFEIHALKMRIKILYYCVRHSVTHNEHISRPPLYIERWVLQIKLYSNTFFESSSWRCKSCGVGFGNSSTETQFWKGDGNLGATCTAPDTTLYGTGAPLSCVWIYVWFHRFWDIVDSWFSPMDRNGTRRKSLCTALRYCFLLL